MPLNSTLLFHKVKNSLQLVSVYYLTVGREEEAGHAAVNIHSCAVNVLCHITVHGVVLLCTQNRRFLFLLLAHFKFLILH